MSKSSSSPGLLNMNDNVASPTKNLSFGRETVGSPDPASPSLANWVCSLENVFSCIETKLPEMWRQQMFAFACWHFFQARGGMLGVTSPMAADKLRSRPQTVSPSPNRLAALDSTVGSDLTQTLDGRPTTTLQGHRRKTTPKKNPFSKEDALDLESRFSKVDYFFSVCLLSS